MLSKTKGAFTRLDKFTFQVKKVNKLNARIKQHHKQQNGLSNKKSQQIFFNSNVNNASTSTVASFVTAHNWWLSKSSVVIYDLDRVSQTTLIIHINNQHYVWSRLSPTITEGKQQQTNINCTYDGPLTSSNDVISKDNHTDHHNCDASSCSRLPFEIVVIDHHAIVPGKDIGYMLEFNRNEHNKMINQTSLKMIAVTNTMPVNQEICQHCQQQQQLQVVGEFRANTNEASEGGDYHQDTDHTTRMISTQGIKLEKNHLWHEVSRSQSLSYPILKLTNGPTHNFNTKRSLSTQSISIKKITNYFSEAKIETNKLNQNQQVSNEDDHHQFNCDTILVNNDAGPNESFNSQAKSRRDNQKVNNQESNQPYDEPESNCICCSSRDQLSIRELTVSSSAADVDQQITLDQRIETTQSSCEKTNDDIISHSLTEPLEEGGDEKNHHSFYRQSIDNIKRIFLDKPIITTTRGEKVAIKMRSHHSHQDNNNSTTSFELNNHFTYPGSYSQRAVADADRNKEETAKQVMPKKKQSPISLMSHNPTYRQCSRPLEMEYPTMLDNLKLHNTGFTWEVKLPYQQSMLTALSGASLPGQNRYRLDQFHCHWGADNKAGSEHSVDGNLYSAELHFVHFHMEKYHSMPKAARHPDGLAVVAVFLEATNDYLNHAELDKITNNLKSIPNKGDGIILKQPIRLGNLLPSMNRSYWSYQGSLTTPPYYESVNWFVLKQPLKCSISQIDKFRQIRGTLSSGSSQLNNNTTGSVRVNHSNSGSGGGGGGGRGDSAYNLPINSNLNVGSQSENAIRSNHRATQPLHGRAIYNHDETQLYPSIRS